MTSVLPWQPTATEHSRQTRAQLLRTIREFFYQRDVLEVDTPILSQGSVTDVHLRAFHTCFEHSHTGKPQSLYLQTSPEYAMKRLLCAQSGPIYQIGKAFRHEGVGRWHNPEFTMLEWYRPGFTHHTLMDEVDALLQVTLSVDAAQKQTYQHAMQEFAGLDPLDAPREALLLALHEHNINIDDEDTLTNDDIMQLLFSVVVEPKIGLQVPCIIYGFPASQAALARLNKDDPRTADRFEVYFKGAELANGFFELANASEQRRRFDDDNKARRQIGYPEIPIDELFLSALETGLPDCAGVALGIERLLMVKIGATHINQVLNFPVTNA